MTEVFRTPWFSVQSTPTPTGDPYYFLELADYVSIVAITVAGTVVLVRQFRPVLDRTTLELPSGHVDAGELPEEAARRELLEETAYEAGELELLGVMAPDVGRLGNRMWCYFARDVKHPAIAAPVESGISVVEVTVPELFAAVADGTFDHALNAAALMLAVVRGRLSQHA